MKKFILFLLVALLYAAHQDVWNWRKADPMLFGFLPPGLAYHAFYSIAAAVMMAVLVRFAWPKKLDEQEADESKNPPPHS